MEEASQSTDSVIRLSRYAKALIENVKKIQIKKLPDEEAKISVSQTVSFLAIAYEKLRNAVEYREAHLVRRAAIERILKRRLALNSQGIGEAENLLRELLWARYFQNESLGVEDSQRVQEIIDKYLFLRGKLLNSQFLFDLLTCEIEETLSPEDARQSALFTFFIYQVLKDKVKIEGVPEEQKNAYFYVALERSFNKSDLPYLRFHLFSLFHKNISQLTHPELETFVPKLKELFKKIDTLISNPFAQRLTRFVRNQMPPFSILFELFKKRKKSIEEILKNRSLLRAQIDELSREKYAQTHARLNSLAIKAIIYIFITKMLFVLLLEHPLSLFFYKEANYTSLAVNTIFPPILMFVIIAFTKIPGSDNTKRLYERIIDIIDEDKSFEKTVSFITKKPSVRRPTLIFVFTIVYTLTFFITFTVLHELLNVLRFNLVSQAIFIFFVSLVAFFGYRIRRIAKEYQLKEKESFFRPFTDFFFMPILSLGKILSRGIAKLNFFGVIFDFFIEAPFKLIIEVIEEWISFIRVKREEID